MAEFVTTVNGQDFRVTAATEAEARTKIANWYREQANWDGMTPDPVPEGVIKAPIVRTEERFGDTTREMTAPLREFTKQSGQAAVEAGFDDPVERLKKTGQTILGGIGTGVMTGLGYAGEAADIVGTPLMNKLRSSLGMPTLESDTAKKRLIRDIGMAAEVAAPELTGVTSGVTRLGRNVKVGQNMPFGNREFGEMTPRMENARIAEDLGILPTPAMQSRTMSAFEAGLQANPFTTGQIADSRQVVRDQIQQRIADQAKMTGNITSTESAGGFLKSGAESYVSDFQRKAQSLYDNVDAIIKPDQAVIPTQTYLQIKEFFRLTKDMPNVQRLLNDSKIGAIMKDIDGSPLGQPIPYETLSQLRSEIGKAVGGMGDMASVDDAKLKKLYAAMSEDMKLVAEAHGKDATKAFKRANDYYKAGMDRIDNTLKDVMKTDKPQDAYNKVVNMMKQGKGSMDTKKLARLMRTLPKDEVNTFRASLIKNMGLASAGGQDATGLVFSPNKFMTEYNTYSPQARRLVFGDADAELQKVARLVDMANDADAALNTSRTANALTSQGILTVALGGIGGWKLALGAYVGSKATAGALMSKPFLKALNAAAKKDMGPMQRLAGGDGFIAEEAKTIMNLYAAQAPSEVQRTADKEE